MDTRQTATGIAKRTPAAGRPNILAATDGSEAAQHAGERAVGLAGFLGAKLYVLYVVDEDGAFRAGIHYGDAVRELAAFGRRATGRTLGVGGDGGCGPRGARRDGRPRSVHPLGCR